MLEEGIIRDLQSHGFSARIQPTRLHGTIVLAARGACRLTVRDASRGEWEMGIYARDAAGIGPRRFLMAEKSYDAPPSFPILAERLRAPVTKALGLNASVPVALALATSPDCGTSDFGLSKTQVPIRPEGRLKGFLALEGSVPSASFRQKVELVAGRFDDQRLIASRHLLVSDARFVGLRGRRAHLLDLLPKEQIVEVHPISPAPLPPR